MGKTPAAKSEDKIPEPTQLKVRNYLVKSYTYPHMYYGIYLNTHRQSR